MSIKELLAMTPLRQAIHRRRVLSRMSTAELEEGLRELDRLDVEDAEREEKHSA